VPSLEIVWMGLVALVLAIMGLRAAGETGQTPVSGIAKISQALFGVLAIRTKAHPVLVNLIAGAISEAGAHAAQDTMHNFKTGYLLNTSPDAQLAGMLIGTVIGAFVSTSAYKLYSTYYEIPGDLFEAPTAIVWLQAARLFTGDTVSVPKRVPEFASVALGFFIIAGVLRSVYPKNYWVQNFVPSGIAFSIGMLNAPSFVLPRVIGGLISWYWVRIKRQPEFMMTLAASGFILGQGSFSLLNVFLTAAGVAHY